MAKKKMPVSEAENRHSSTHNDPPRQRCGRGVHDAGISFGITHQPRSILCPKRSVFPDEILSCSFHTSYAEAPFLGSEFSISHPCSKVNGISCGRSVMYKMVFPMRCSLLCSGCEYITPPADLQPPGIMDIRTGLGRSCGKMSRQGKCCWGRHHRPYFPRGHGICPDCARRQNSGSAPARPGR